MRQVKRLISKVAHYYYETEEIETFIGKIVTQVFISSGNEVIKFIFNDDTYSCFMTSGDCCSNTWINDFLGVSALLNTPILEIEVKETVSSWEGYDNLQDYGIVFKTIKGRCDLIYRNSSNGYYGGSLDPVELANSSKGTWTEIIDDNWTA